MNAKEPLYCRPDAYELFQSQLGNLDAPSGLLAAAVAISMHELQGIRLQAVEHRLDVLANRVRNRVHGQSPDALMAHLHQVLFDEEGFLGSREDYYDPRNSYVPMVLERKCGNPITLTLVYRCIAARLGLTVHGINAPGHFLARVQLEGSWTLVDPFFGGQILSRDEALERIEQMIGRRLPDAEIDEKQGDTDEVSLDPMFPPASHRDWLARMLRNLRTIFGQQGRDNDMAAMNELFHML